MSGAPIPAPSSIVALLASLDFDATVAFYRLLDFSPVSRQDDFALMRHGEARPELDFWRNTQPADKP